MVAWLMRTVFDRSLSSYRYVIILLKNHYFAIIIRTFGIFKLHLQFKVFFFSCFCVHKDKQLPIIVFYVILTVLLPI